MQVGEQTNEVVKEAVEETKEVPEMLEYLTEEPLEEPLAEGVEGLPEELLEGDEPGAGELLLEEIDPVDVRELILSKEEVLLEALLNVRILARAALDDVLEVGAEGGNEATLGLVLLHGDTVDVVPAFVVG